MPIFAIVPQPNPNNAKLPGAIAEHFKDASLQLEGNSGWLVSFNGTAQQISDKMHITDGLNGAAMVLEVASYFGRANPNIWTWVKNNWDKAKSA